MSCQSERNGGRLRRWGFARAAAALLAVFLAGCAPRPAELADPAAPRAGYQRRIMLVLERADFRPVAGAQVTIETLAPTRLVSPSGGQGRTDARGGLELVFEPLPEYDRSAAKAGDVVADFPVRAKLTIGGTGAGSLVRWIDDRETYARYADPLYQGLSRDPETGVTYYSLIVP
jgi:hypothetical protein